MNARPLFAAVLALGLGLSAASAALATDKASIIAFYQSYLNMVSANNYVEISRDTPETWDAQFDAAAQAAGFEDSAAALAAGETLSADSDVAALRQAVADTINRQYKPYRE